MGRLFCGEKCSDIHLCNNICRILFCKRLVNETIGYKIFAENLLPGSWTANPHHLELEMLPLCGVKKKEVIDNGFIWRKFDLVLYSDFCLSIGRAQPSYFFVWSTSVTIYVLTSVMIILVWNFFFSTIFLVQATFLFTKMVTACQCCILRWKKTAVPI